MQHTVQTYPSTFGYCWHIQAYIKSDITVDAQNKKTLKIKMFFSNKQLLDSRNSEVI